MERIARMRAKNCLKSYQLYGGKSIPYLIVSLDGKKVRKLCILSLITSIDGESVHDASFFLLEISNASANIEKHFNMYFTTSFDFHVHFLRT